MFSINGRTVGSKAFASSTVNSRGKLAADSMRFKLLAAQVGTDRRR
jgi:hypothetical protein